LMISPLDRWPNYCPMDQCCKFARKIGVFIQLPYPVDHWTMCGGASCERTKRGKGDSGTLTSPFRRLAVSPVRIFPLLLRPLAEGARRTADLFIIPFEHSDPGVGQEHFDGSSWVAVLEVPECLQKPGLPLVQPRAAGRFAGWRWPLARWREFVGIESRCLPLLR
jgi:hypothetical protein